MSAPVVLVTSRSFASGRRDLRSELAAAGATVVDGPPDHDATGLAPLLTDAVVWIAGTAAIGADLLELAPSLKLIARHGVGCDAVDLEAASARGVVVTNTPGANSDSVADHTLALLLAALRGVVRGDRDLRADDWSPWPSRELGGLAVGIVGFGRIGRGVAKRLSGFGCRLLAVDPALPEAQFADAGVEGTDLAGLSGRVDIVTLHAPGGSAIIDTAWLLDARPGLILVNTARAALVDESSVADALRDGRLAAYAADTLSGEGAPGAGGALLDPDLADLVVLTPHRAAQSVEAVDRMGGGAVEAVLDLLAGRRPQHVVTT